MYTVIQVYVLVTSNVTLNYFPEMLFSNLQDSFSRVNSRGQNRKYDVFAACAPEC